MYRPEPEYIEAGKPGVIFRGEKRHYIFGMSVDSPFDLRGIMVHYYRYAASQPGRSNGSSGRSGDAWIYEPTKREVERVESPPDWMTLSEAEIVLGEWEGFAGEVTDYSWDCAGARQVLAPVNSHRPIFPSDPHAAFGPGGRSLAADPWELRDAFVIEGTPRDNSHIHSRRILYLDRQTMRVLYGFSYDANRELLEIHTTLGRWHEDHPRPCEHWTSVPKPLTNKTIAQVIANVQTGTSMRIEYGDNRGCGPASKGKIRRMTDVGRHCVAAGTLVETEDGEVPIETVAVGDRVWGFDLASGKREIGIVTRTTRSESETTLVLGKSLRLTAEHPVYSDGQWRPAGVLKDGDRVVSANGEILILGQPESIEGAIEVFDLTVEGTENFFAGNILVHNKKGR